MEPKVFFGGDDQLIDGFSAPELIIEAQNPHQGALFDGVSSDIFSLGVTIFQIRTGLMPFNRAVGGDAAYQLI